MIYILYGLQDYLINKKINELTNNINQYEIEKFDLENSNLKEIIDSATTISLFSLNKTIIVYNSYVFSSTKKTCDEKEIEILQKYIENQNKDTTIIFVVSNEKLDSRKKIVTLAKKYCEIIEFNEVKNTEKIIEEMIKPYKININQIRLLINYTGDNLYILENEINKLKIYKNDDLQITEDDIINVTTKNINTDIFVLIDNIINKNIDDALTSYYELIKVGEEPIKILVLLANQFRLMYQVKELSKKGYRIYDIMDLLDQKQYPIQKAIQKGYNYDSKLLLDYLNKLSELDINIKTGKVDKNIGLELFILNV